MCFAGQAQAPLPLRPVLVQPLELGEEPDLEVDAAHYAAAAQLLILALAAHPSLADLMLFPTGLQASTEAPDKARSLLLWRKVINGLCKCLTRWLSLFTRLAVTTVVNPHGFCCVAIKGCPS